jgi:hypothetical protein
MHRSVQYCARYKLFVYNTPSQFEVFFLQEIQILNIKN